MDVNSRGIGTYLECILDSWDKRRGVESRRDGRRKIEKQENRYSVPIHVTAYNPEMDAHVTLRLARVNFLSCTTISFRCAFFPLRAAYYTRGWNGCIDVTSSFSSQEVSPSFRTAVVRTESARALAHFRNTLGTRDIGYCIFIGYLPVRSDEGGRVAVSCRAPTDWENQVSEDRNSREGVNFSSKLHRPDFKPAR